MLNDQKKVFHYLLNHTVHFLNHFIKSYPKINLKIQELNTDTIINQLKEGRLDAGIAATPLKLESLEERPLYYEPFVGYIPNNHRLNGVKELIQEEIFTQLNINDRHSKFNSNKFELGKIISFLNQKAKETKSK